MHHWLMLCFLKLFGRTHLEYAALLFVNYVRFIPLMKWGNLSSKKNYHCTFPESSIIFFLPQKGFIRGKVNAVDLQWSCSTSGYLKKIVHFLNIRLFLLFWDAWHQHKCFL